MSDYPKPINLWSRASHWSSVSRTAAREARVQLVRIRRVGSRRVAHPYHIRGPKWRRAGLAGPTWTIKPALTEDVPSWLVRLEQSNQRWLKTCWAGWSGLNNQTSVDWRRAELAGPVWPIKPALTEDVLSWLVRFDQWKWSDLSMSVHSPPSVKPVKAQAFVPRSFHISPDPYQSTVHQASSLLRRRRLFPARSISVRIRISPQSTKRQAC